MKKLILTITAAASILTTNAQTPGDLDATFGIGGYAMTDNYQNTGEVFWDLAVLADDKIVHVGYTDDGNDTDVLVTKFLADGTPDSTFASDGVLVIDLSLGLNEEARGVYEMSDGKLLITGYVSDAINQSYDAFLMRLNADGTVDDTFGSTSPGRTHFNAGDNLIAYGRSIVTVGTEIYVGASCLSGGQADMFLFNFTQGGGLDVSFSTGGSAQVDVDGDDDELYAMDMTSNGNFVLVGTSLNAGVQSAVVTTLSSFGTPTSFGNQKFDFGDGWNEANDVYVDANNYIYVAGAEGNDPNIDGFVMRLKNDGSGELDSTYATNGVMQSDPGATTSLYFRKVMPVWDGGVVVTGNLGGATIELYAMMLESDGSLQGNFQGGDVYVPFSISAISAQAFGGGMQSDGAIIIGGYLESQDFVGENMFMVRLNAYKDVTSVLEVKNQFVNVYPNPATSSFNIDMNGIESVKLISMQGKVVNTWFGNQNTFEIPANTESGAYILQMNSSEGTATARIVIQ